MDLSSLLHSFQEASGPWVCLRKLGACEESVYNSSQTGHEELPRARSVRTDTSAGTRETKHQMCGEIVHATVNDLLPDTGAKTHWVL